MLFAYLKAFFFLMGTGSKYRRKYKVLSKYESEPLTISCQSTL